MNRLMAFLGFDDAEVEDDDGPANGDGVETPKRRGQLFGLSTQKQTEIVVLQPGTFEDARAAADYLKMRRPVVVNLQGAHGELARRIVDFTSGVTYALDGHMLRVGEEIFLFTPSHISITADLGSGNDHTLFPLE